MTELREQNGLAVSCPEFNRLKNNNYMRQTDREADVRCDRCNSTNNHAQIHKHTANHNVPQRLLLKTTQD